MATSSLAPQGAAFLYDAAHKGLSEQWQWIDALDTKAGVVLAADGLLAGLLFTSDSFLWLAPTWTSVAITVLLLGSLTLALLAFATRRYETAPDVEDLVRFNHLSSDQIQWRALSDLLFALEVNESKMAQKSNLLFYSGLMLLVTVVLFGAYFVNALIP
jgi:hypothetical protein